MVAFEDRFWGDKNAGYDVLYHNMKYGNNASVKVTEFIRERSTVEENYAKSLIKLAKSACSVTQLGSFEPLWGVLRVATERLANAHHLVVVKLQELAKEVKEYGDKQKDKHKAAKEEFSTTAEIVQTMQAITASLTKAKEMYYARCHEYEKLKKEGTSAKEIEKAEAKMKKAGEEYKSIVEKREIIRNEFHDKIVETSRKFQKIEEEHLKTIIGHLDIYIDSHLSGWKMMEEVHTEFRERLRALSIDKLLDQLVRSRGTGREIPGVITFEEYQEQIENSVIAENSPSMSNRSQTMKPQLSGFPLHKKKKEKKEKEKKTKKKRQRQDKDKDKDKGNLSQSSNSQDSPEHQENGPVESPGSEGSEMASNQSFEVDEEGYRIRPPDTESAKSVGNSSDSDSDSDDEDEPRRIQVTIKPVEDQLSQTASVDEIKKITESLSLSSPASMRRNVSSASGLSDGFRARAATENTRPKLSRSSDDLLDINFGQNKTITSPGSDSSLSVASTSMDITSSKDNSNAGISSLGTFESFSSLGPFATSSPAASISIDSNDKTEVPNNEDVPPALPKKKSSVTNMTNDDHSVPPPLPAKRDGAAGVLPFPNSGLGSVNNVASNDAAKPGTTPPVIMRPPGTGGDIARAGTTGSALARPRPQGAQKKTSITMNSQPPVQQSQASAMSYSEELFSFMSDIDFNNKSKQPTKDSEDGGPKTPKTPSKVSYIGSVALSSSSETTSTQVMTRAATTTALQGLDEPQDKQENHGGIVRSKTVGSIPSIPSRSLSHKEEVLPIAVAFIESVNAFFRGNDYKGCMVKVTGDITVSFPASIVAQLTSEKELPSLIFFVTGTSSLEQLVPNKTLITSQGQQSGGDAVSYKFNMKALSEHLKKQTESSTSSYYNIDILKYEVRTTGIHSTPLQLCSFWKCEPTSTNIRIDYRYNPACMSTPCALNNVSVIAPVNGGVTIMQSKPSATWSAESQRAVWILPEVSNPKDSDGSLRARLDLTEGPSTPSRIAVQFSSTGATISKLNFELKSDAYKLSLVKKQISSGKYIAES